MDIYICMHIYISIYVHIYIYICIVNLAIYDNWHDWFQVQVKLLCMPEMFYLIILLGACMGYVSRRSWIEDGTASGRIVV